MGFISGASKQQGKVLGSVDASQTADKMIDNNAEKISFIEPMTVRDLGQPPNLDVRKNANPHSTDYYTLGAVYPPKFSKGGW